MGGTAGREVLLRFSAAALLFRASLHVSIPILAPSARVLGASLSLIGLILATYGFTQCARRIPLGLWADRSGRPRPFIQGGFLPALATGPGALLLFRGVAAAAASWVAFTVFFAGYFPAGEASRAMGAFQALYAVG